MKDAATKDAATKDEAMAQSDELLEALGPVLAELNRLGVRYCIGGSVASSIHGVPRSTLDVDLAAELDEPAARKLVAALANDYYASESAAVDAVRRRTCFNLLHFATSSKIDIFVSKNRQFDRAVQDRAAVRSLGDEDALSARVVSAEDIILLKLEWFRLGDEASERQWRDLTSVAKLQAHRLDCEYLRLWARELGLTDLLDRLLAEIGSESP